MGRKLTGSIERRGDVWDASVPRRRGEPGRIQATFDALTAAEAWRAAQITRLESGLDAEPPAPGTPGYRPSPGRAARRAADKVARAAVGAAAPAAGERKARPGRPPVAGDMDGPDGPDLASWGERMCREHYELGRHGNPDTARATRAIIRSHLAHIFPTGIPADGEAGAVRLNEWVLAQAGRIVDADDFPERHRLGLPAVPLPARPYAESTVNERLVVLRRVLKFIAVRDRRIINFAEGIQAQAPVGWTETRPKLLTYAETALLASDMHVIHQLTLWLLRVLGPRLSEPYGILVGDVIDDGERMALLFQAQGGKRFALWGDEVGEVIETTHKKGGKTAAAFRLVGVPYQLAELIRLVIAAFHTDPVTGAVDQDARLIPAIRSAGGGQEGFRAALAHAGVVTAIEMAADERLLPHGQRKALCSDFADAEIGEVLARLWAGHRAGKDVHGAVYVLNRIQYKRLLPAVKALEDMIEAEVGSSLIVPTTRRPVYGAGTDRSRLAHADVVLAEAGWQLSGIDDDRITVEEAAALLGMSSLAAVRRLFPAQIPAVKDAKGRWRPLRDDVCAWRDRNDGKVRLPVLAEDLLITYWQARELTLKLLAKPPVKDPYSREFLLTAEQADRVRAECHRVRALRERAVPVSVACDELNLRHPSVSALANQGRLDWDPETDTSGMRFITKDSLAEERARRGRLTEPVVGAAALSKAAGLNDAALKALLAQGLLVRARRSEGFTRASVRHWITGFRPELLDAGLL